MGHSCKKQLLGFPSEADLGSYFEFVDQYWNGEEKIAIDDTSAPTSRNIPTAPGREPTDCVARKAAWWEDRTLLNSERQVKISRNLLGYNILENNLLLTC